MSNFTTELRFICETEANYLESKGFNDIDTILNNSVDKIFNFDFPIFDENYRKPLEKKILRYYYTREICDETVGLWKLRLNNRLNLIMPYYNQLYLSELIKFNPLYDVDLTTDHTRKNDNTQNDTGSKSLTSALTSTKSGENNTDGSINKTYEDHNVTTNKSTGKTITNEGNVFTPGVVTTTNDHGWSHNDLHILELHSDYENKTDETHKDFTNVTPNVTVTDTGNKWDYYSDTPQGTVGNLENLSYLTNARNNTDSNTQKTTGQTQTYNEGESHVTKTSKQSANDSHVTAFSDDRTNTVTKTGTDQNNRDVTVNNTTNDNGTSDTTGKENSDNHSKTSYFENFIQNNNESQTSENDTTFNGVEQYVEHVIGKTSGSSYSKMIMEFRDTFLNIDKMIINNLSDLFFGLYE